MLMTLLIASAILWVIFYIITPVPTTPTGMRILNGARLLVACILALSLLYVLFVSRIG